MLKTYKKLSAHAILKQATKDNDKVTAPCIAPYSITFGYKLHSMSIVDDNKNVIAKLELKVKAANLARNILDKTR